MISAHEISSNIFRRRLYGIYTDYTLTTAPVLAIKSTYIHAYIVADVRIRVPENNINGCELVLEEAHYCIFLVSQQCGLILVNFLYSRIITF